MRRRLLLLAIVTLLSLLLIRLLLGPIRSGPRLASAVLRFADSSWPQAQLVDASDDLTALSQGYRTAESRPAGLPNQEPPLYELELQWADGQNLRLHLTHDQRIFDLAAGQELFLDRLARETLDKYVLQLREQRFGELLHWKEASQLVGNRQIFTIIDLETGLSWRTQRRAGSRHADIQPLTKEDTAIMKAAYGGAWSWDRRAVIVEAGGRRIAASINGMPHGSGALVNNFPGHHCLHFLSSMTHGGRNADPVHQLMVHKAAGLLHEYLDELEPALLQRTLLEMAGQGDVAVVHLGIINDRPLDNSPAQQVAEIRDIRIWRSQVGEARDGELSGIYEVSVLYKGDVSQYRTSVTVRSRYIGGLGKWLVEPDFIDQLMAARR